MRLFLLVLLPALTACDIQDDAAREKLTVTYDKQRIRDGAAKTARAAKAAAVGVGNVASSTGRAIEKEVGDIDVDVKVRRKPTEKTE